MGRIRVPRTSQPQQPVGIDWGNPIARGLVFAAVPGLPEFISGTPATPMGAGSTKVNLKGRAFYTPGVTSDGYYWAVGSGHPVYTIGQSDTSFVLADVKTTSAYNSMVGIPYRSGAWAIPFFAWNGLGTQSDGLRVDVAYSPNSTTFTAGIGGASFFGSSTGLTSYCSRRSVGAVSFYRGGTFHSSGSITAGSPDFSNKQPVMLFNQSNTGSGAGMSAYGNLVLIWNRALSGAEIKSLSDNPWQIFQPLARNVFSDVPATGGSHATSGALTGAGSTLSGTAARFRAFATSGALAPTGAEITGTAVHNIPHATSGALAPTGAEIVGAAARASPGFITHDTSGALATIGAEAAGTAARFRAMATSGALATSGAEITGSAARFRAFDTSGVLTNAGATITGSANRYREMGTSGALAPTGATITGTSVRYRTMDTSGALATAGAEITGSAARFRAFGTSGTLATAGAEINGTAARSTPGVGVYPDPSQVLSGVMYGPTGTEYTGTLSIVLDLNTGRLFKILTTKVGLLL